MKLLLRIPLLIKIVNSDKCFSFSFSNYFPNNAKTEEEFLVQPRVSIRNFIVFSYPFGTENGCMKYNGNL